MQLISKYNKRIRYLLCVIHLFSKYACLVNMLFLLKTKKELLLLMHFRVFYTVQKGSQIKYGSIKVVNFMIKILKNG